MSRDDRLRGQFHAAYELDVYLKGEGTVKYPALFYKGALSFTHLPANAYYVEVWTNGERIRTAEKDENGKWVLS